MRRNWRSLIAVWLVGCGAAGETLPTTEPAEPAVEPGPASGTDEGPGEDTPGTEPTTGGSPGDTRLEATAEALATQLAAEGRVALYTIEFATGGAELLPEAHPVLGQVLLLLQNDAELRLAVEVHSDSQGGAAFNLRTSTERAEAIVAWLVAQGADAARLEAVGRGETQPIAPNRRPAGRAANRRVELVAR